MHAIHRRCRSLIYSSLITINILLQKMPRIIILAYLVGRDSYSRKRLKVNLQSARKPAYGKKVDSSRTTFF